MLESFKCTATNKHKFMRIEIDLLRKILWEELSEICGDIGWTFGVPRKPWARCNCTLYLKFLFFWCSWNWFALGIGKWLVQVMPNVFSMMWHIELQEFWVLYFESTPLFAGWGKIVKREEAYAKGSKETWEGKWQTGWRACIRLESKYDKSTSLSWVNSSLYLWPGKIIIIIESNCDFP